MLKAFILMESWHITRLGFNEYWPIESVSFKILAQKLLIYGSKPLILGLHEPRYRTL